MVNPVPVSYSAPSTPMAAGRFLTPALPAWRLAMATSTWAEVGTNTLADIDPEDDPELNPSYPGGAPWRGTGGQSAVINAWCGGAWCEQKKRLYIVGGGHADYAGNELYYWDATTATFVLATNPTGAIGNTGDLTTGEATARYFDGQPRSFHTYGNMAVRNGVLWITGGAVFVSGGASGRPFYFDEDAAEWVTDSEQNTGSYGSIAYDPVRDRLFTMGALSSTGSFYSPATHANTGTSQAMTGGGDNRCIYSPLLDKIIFINNPTRIQLVDPAGVAATTLVTTDTWPIEGIKGSDPWAYDTKRDRLLFWKGGTTMYALNIPPGGTGTWEWETLTLSGANAVTPTDPVSVGTWGRAWYSESMDCYGVVNSISQKMYVFSLGEP